MICIRAINICMNSDKKNDNKEDEQEQDCILFADSPLYWAHAPPV